MRPVVPRRTIRVSQIRLPSSTMAKSTVSSVHTNMTYAPILQSQAIKAGGQVYLSGQIPADVEGNLIKRSTRKRTIIKNTEAILNEAGSELDRVVKVVINVKDLSIMPDFASVYDPKFPHRPARSMVEVTRLPAGVDIQVDFTAVV
ncbi:LOW QUALITY PROTEIN: protein MMF1, mitochondrial [Aspergillus udagawae]|uniref:Protein MMF1, mitochondrial n=1 Tax=Aspergillus udagawae TaxID=91492 RepID=A0A8H3SH68_9EURO|nr:LOW QUALITY PROTEIN: protein MMF1, mitochondrial [Aspergillus udagawae]